MPRVELPSKQADGSQNWVNLKDSDDFMASDLFALHRAVRLKSGPGGEVDYSPQEQMDDRINAFLTSAITAWSFPSPIPGNNGVAAGDVTIGRAMRARDWAVLRKAAQPLIDELEGEGLPDPKAAAEQLTRVFLWQSNRLADQSRCPPWPDGFPTVMLTYYRWLEDRGMHPRDVDRLTHAELFWIPVIESAREDAANQLAKQEETPPRRLGRE